MKKIKIIYEDKNIIVVDKPAHLLTVATTKEKEKTMFHQVFMYEKQKNKNNKVFVVHRLDRDTSGLIIFAKNLKTKVLLQNNWNKLVVLREYTAVVEGKVKKDSGTIQSYLKENKALITYSTNDKTGKLAITKYKVIKTNNKYTLLNIYILTGRKNQIRVHMKDIGHSIVGDKKYGSCQNPIQRLCLHANKLTFYHPITKQLLSLESKVPKKFDDLVSKKERK